MDEAIALRPPDGGNSDVHRLWNGHGCDDRLRPHGRLWSRNVGRTRRRTDWRRHGLARRTVAATAQPAHGLTARSTNRTSRPPGQAQTPNPQFAKSLSEISGHASFS